ncbi:MAG: PCI domain-containing protein [archaeon]|nr:PCI domain-containing protein [archaeon]
MMDEDEKKIKELKEKMESKEEDLEKLDKASYLFEIGKIYKKNHNKEEALKFFKETIEKTNSFNTKIDSYFEILHLGLFSKDTDLLKEFFPKVESLIKDSGDWEKKNRLKVYNGLYCIINKDFVQAGDLFLHALSTFTSYELFDFKTFVFYTAITNIITVDRAKLKTAIIDNSDVISCINEIPNLETFLNNFYEGNYAEFFKAFYQIIQQVKRDFFMENHCNYFIKEMRIKVYSQFLQSYRSVTIENMAKVFGVSTKFIDDELSNFISQGRLSAKIDKVSGIIQSISDEPTVDRFNNVIHESDLLMNKIHKLSKLLEI